MQFRYFLPGTRRSVPAVLPHYFSTSTTPQHPAPSTYPAPDLVTAEETLLQSIQRKVRTAGRSLFSKRHVAYSYDWNSESKQSRFDPHTSLEHIDFFRTNTDGTPKRTVLTFSGSSAAFDANCLSDHLIGESDGIETPAEKAKKGIQEAVGFPKRLVHAMGGREIHRYTQFITANYNNAESNRKKLHKTNRHPDTYYSYEALAFAEKLLPLFASEYEILPDGTVSGQRRPLEEVITNAHNVTMVAQSYGGAFVRQMTNVTRQHLHDLHYNEHEIADIFNSLVFIGFGPVTNALSDNRTPLNSVYFANPQDKRSRQHIRGFSSLIPEGLGSQSPLYITGLNHNTTVVWAAPTTYDAFTYIKDCDGSEQRVMDHEKHTLPFYLAFARILDNGEIPLGHIPFVTLIRSALRNATMRDHATTMTELLSYNPRILENTVDASTHHPFLPTLSGTREVAEKEINVALERAREEMKVETGATRVSSHRNSLSYVPGGTPKQTAGTMLWTEKETERREESKSRVMEK